MSKKNPRQNQQRKEKRDDVKKCLRDFIITIETGLVTLGEFSVLSPRKSVFIQKKTGKKSGIAITNGVGRKYILVLGKVATRPRHNTEYIFSQIAVNILLYNIY